MVKNLLMTAAVAAMALSAKAEKVELPISGGWGTTSPTTGSLTLNFSSQWAEFGLCADAIDPAVIESSTVEYEIYAGTFQLKVEDGVDGEGKYIDLPEDGTVTAEFSGFTANVTTYNLQAKEANSSIYLKSVTLKNVDGIESEATYKGCVWGCNSTDIIYTSQWGELGGSGWAVTIEEGETITYTIELNEGCPANVQFKAIDAADATEHYLPIEEGATSASYKSEVSLKSLTIQYAGETVPSGVLSVKSVYYEINAGGGVEYAPAIYVVGDADGLTWNLPGMEVPGTNGIYSFKLTNASSFKFSTVETTSWDEFNAAAYYVDGGVESFDVGEIFSYPLVQGDANNVLPYVGDYQFEVQLDIPDNPWMDVTILTEEPKGEIYEIYLLGTMNNWSADPNYMFSSSDGIVYTLSGVSVSVGDEFKVADANWSTIDYGGASNMKAGVVYELTKQGSNCTVAQDFEDVTFIFNYENKTLQISTSGIASVAADTDAEAVYYNLQGIRVDNPENGIFVKRVGSKATTVFVK